MNRAVMVLAAGLMLAIYGAGMYYVGRKLYRWMQLVVPEGSRYVFFAIIAVLVIALVLAFLPLDVSIRKYLVWFAWFLIGLYILFLTYFLFSEVVVLVGRLTKLIESPIPPGVTIAVGWAVLAIVAGMAAFGIYYGKQIAHTSYNIAISKETSLEELNVVLISDTHLWYDNDDKWVAKLAEEINAAQPDIVLIAGDIFNDNFKALTNPEDAIRSLQTIKTTYGMYACLGNHDSGGTFPEMLDFLERSGVTVLMDEHRVIDGKFIVVGRGDPQPIRGVAPARQELAAVMDGIDAALPIIVIDHQPGFANEYGSEVDLVLAGHTHAGQFFPATAVTHFMGLNYGHYPKNENRPHVIVTSGAGLWGPPFRIGSSNEVVSIQLEFK